MNPPDINKRIQTGVKKMPKVIPTHLFLIHPVAKPSTMEIIPIAKPRIAIPTITFCLLSRVPGIEKYLCF
jgi:hypothetical protein